MDQLDVRRLAAEGYLADLEHHDTLDSTQQRAFEVAAAVPPASLPFLVIAEQQSAGRGRGGNTWWTGRGSLAFSLLFDPAAWGSDRPLLPARSLAVAVAIADAVGPLLAGRNVGLHWPNDVFVDGRKLAGVLLDVLPDYRHVLGVGLNVNNTLEGAPDDVCARATTLRELTGQTHDRTELLLALLASLKSALELTSEAPQLLGQRFQQLCLQVGCELTVEASGRRTRGRCTGIAHDGALLLETSTGEQRIYSGRLV